MDKILHLKHRITGQEKEFVIKQASSLMYLIDVLGINDSVKEEGIDKSLFSAPSEKEIVESFKKDYVYLALHNDIVVGFAILINRKDKERDLSIFTPYQSEDCLTFDNVEVGKDFRGYGLEKEFIKIAFDRQIEKRLPYLLAVVSKDNLPSFNSFMKLGFEIKQSDVSIYGSKRELVEHKL